MNPLSYFLLMFNGYIFIFLILASCAPAPYAERPFTEQGYGTPFGYSLTEKCFIGEETKTPSSTVFTQGFFSNLKLNSVLTPSFIKNIELGGYYVYDLMYSTISSKKYTKNYYNNCFTQDKYSEENYEDALISILGVFQSFELKYKNYLQKNKIKKVNIQVLPNYEERKNRFVPDRDPVYMINNAFYSSRQNTLVFLPQGETKSGNIPFDSIPLWKSPGVVMHEYAHHIFNEFIDVKYFAAAESFGSCTLDHLSPVSSKVVKENTQKISKQIVMQALNEGFADLFSYIVNDTNNLYRGMGRMERSRDVEAPYFRNFEGKRLIDKKINIFITSGHQRTDGINFNSIHIVGASFAHFFHQALSESLLNQRQKLNILTLWVKKLPSIFRSASNSKILMEKGYLEFYRILKNNNLRTKAENKNICKNYFEGFPAIQFDCNL